MWECPQFLNLHRTQNPLKALLPYRFQKNVAGLAFRLPWLASPTKWITCLCAGHFVEAADNSSDNKMQPTSRLDIVPLFATVEDPWQFDRPWHTDEAFCQHVGGRVGLRGVLALLPSLTRESDGYQRNKRRMSNPSPVAHSAPWAVAFRITMWRYRCFTCSKVCG